MKNIIEILKGIWLSKIESEIYICILKNNKIWVSKIATGTNIKRTTIYPYIESLLKKWFISKTIKWKRVLYIAESPVNILNELEIKKKKFVEKIPFLEDLLQNSRWKTKVEFYEWKKWLMKIYMEMARNFWNIHTFFSPEKFFKVFTKQEDDEIIKEIKKHDSKSYNLVENNDLWKEYVKSGNWNDIRLLPKEIKVPIDVVMYKNNVALISLDDISWVVIRDKDITDFIRWIHNFLWFKKVPGE